MAALEVVSHQVVQELWVSSPPERPSGVWRRRSAYGCRELLLQLDTTMAPEEIEPACGYPVLRNGFRTSTPTKSPSLSVTTTQPFASATAAMMVSSALRGRPAAVPSAMSLAQTSPAFSSNGRTRPANRVEGPSGPG